MKKYILIITILLCVAIAGAEPNPGHTCTDIDTFDTSYPCKGLYVEDPSTGGNLLQFPMGLDKAFFVGANLKTVGNVELLLGNVLVDSGGLSVSQGITYGTRLSKLDVSQTPSATVRVDDFLIGGSGAVGRRATPGRALVDYTGNTLFINYVDAGTPDWGTVLIGGNNVRILNGKLGVNKTPVKTFDVEGEIRGNVLCIQNDCRSSWPSGSSSITGTPNYVSKFNAAGTNIINSIIYDTGVNVGVGTSAPTEKLHVVGNIASTGDVMSGNDVYAANDLQVGGVIKSASGGDVIIQLG